MIPFVLVLVLVILIVIENRIGYIILARKSLIIRIDPALWEEIDRWAKDELRSINGQIEYLLRDAVVKRRRAKLPEPPPEPDEPNEGDGS